MLMQFCLAHRAKSVFALAFRNNYASHVVSSYRKYSIKKFNFSLAKNVKGSVRFVSRPAKLASNPKFSIQASSEVKRLLNLSKVVKGKLAGAVLLLLVSSAVSMSVPFCIGKLIDIMVSSESDIKTSLVTICQILVAVFALGAAANFGRVYLMNISCQRVVNDLRKRTFSSIVCQETAFFDSNKTGELINRLSSDTATVGSSITNNISDGLRSLFSFIAGASLMIYTCPQLASLGLITVAPVAGLAVIFGKILRKNSQNVQDALASATQVAEERISNIRTVQAFLKVDEERRVYGSKIDSVMSFATKESLSRALFFGMTGFSGNLIILSVLYYGGGMMSDNIITIGSLSAFLMYATYVGISIGGLSSFYSELMKGLGASTRLWELIERKSEIAVIGGRILPALRGEISFNNITFTYPSRPDTPVLSDFSLSIPAGSVYALVGASGCGKSTVGSLLLRLYDCENGSVSVDGEDVKILDLQWLRRNIGIVNQDPTLFSFSIRENITYGSPEGVDVDDALIKDVLLKANALDFVTKMPNGLDSIVGERGVMLSGGQRQRLAIARALIKNPKILILDEATSALDAESEYLVQTALEDLMKQRTVITIAHRLSTVKKADTIIVLENGKVIERGKYDELLSAEGPFYRLVQRQNLKPP